MKRAHGWPRHKRWYNIKMDVKTRYVCILLNLIQERNRQMLNGNRSSVSLVCGMSLGHTSGSLFRLGCALWVGCALREEEGNIEQLWTSGWISLLYPTGYVNIGVVKCIYTSKMTDWQTMGNKTLFLHNQKILTMERTTLLLNILKQSSSHGATTLSGLELRHYRGFTITLSYTHSLGRIPLDEWLVWRRDLYLTTYNIHKRKTSMPNARFKPAVPASGLPQTHAFDRAATVICLT